MTFAKVVFKFVDHLFKNAQNPKKLRKKYADVKVEKDILYGENPKEELLDIHYLPKTDGEPYPVIMEIHGGGFSAGDKKYRAVLSSFYAKETGAFVVNVNYGLGGKTICPVPVRQLVNAVNWVVANKEKYNLDLSRFVVTGDSAGGYYSSMLSVLQDSPFLQELYQAKPQARFGAALLNCGVYDMRLALKQKILLNLTKGVAHDYAGITPKEIETFKYKEGMSPIEHITEQFPKTLVIYAEQDFFCGGQGEAICQKLKDLGVYHESYGSTEFSDNHTFSLTWKSKAAQEATALSISFLNRYFKGEI